jgi:endoglucanase
MKIWTLLALVCLVTGTLFAEDAGLLAPKGKPGELVYVPFPVPIKVDGDPSDWSRIEKITVDTGPYTTGDPTDNGQFTFSVCADKQNIYLLMTMPDKKIVGGRHGADFWNEDSFEFYFNFSGNLDAMEFTEGIVQINVNATNLKIDDLYGLSLSGVRFEEEGYYVFGKAFETEDGWGIEVGIKLENNLEPYHGFTIGIQTQANGATVKDRDSKLIWSIYDTSDISWKTPKLFGTGVFYEIGRTDVPQPQRKNIPKVVKRKTVPIDQLPKIRANQTGYFPKAPKLAVMVSDRSDPLDFEIVDSEGKTVFTGKSLPRGEDTTSKDSIHHIDFSAFKKPGTGYVIKSDGKSSFPFDISGGLYAQLTKDAFNYFYQNRLGTELKTEYAGETWARPAIFVSDEAVKAVDYPPTADGIWPERNYVLNAGKGWMDAGDYGKYIVNGGITVWTLLNLYERNPKAFPDGSMKIPEQGNGIPDILDEVRWEMDFFLGMQVPDGHPQAGMVHHKLHEKSWLPHPYKAPERTDTRFAMKPSTAATLNFAAACAQFARVYAPYNKEFSDRCLAAAEKAWKAAVANPKELFSMVGYDGGGDYDDAKVEDEFFWAACELFITTGNPEYRDAMDPFMATPEFKNVLIEANSPLTWQSTAGLGLLSLVTVKNKAEASLIKMIRGKITEGADRYLAQLDVEGYPVPLLDFWWGSNSQVLNKMILMAYAYDQTGKDKYLYGMTRSMDYILGTNCNAKSFISGWGEYPMFYPHHRLWANDETLGYPPPPPGAISGGPNQDSNDDGTAFFAKKVGRGRRYADDTRSYSSNEVAINWNAPLVWAVAYMDEQLNPESDIPKAAKGSGNSKTRALYLLAAAVLVAGLYMLYMFVAKKRKKK